MDFASTAEWRGRKLVMKTKSGKAATAKRAKEIRAEIRRLQLEADKIFSVSRVGPQKRGKRKQS